MEKHNFYQKDLCISIRSTCESIDKTQFQEIFQKKRENKRLKTKFMFEETDLKERAAVCYGRLNRRNLETTKEIQKLSRKINQLKSKMQDSYHDEPSLDFDEGCRAKCLPEPAFLHQDAFDIVTPVIKFCPNTRPILRRTQSQPCL
ncbi:unnamed protein product [Blepharisma stoltei]|uniref:Uncharacterized protein n=1 Tax=Blepharisma stoltei TaxID=1481888 RepID=A0AAU9ITK3_9CILI|nr:unnamed protein product [Blepharisma stoltei]